MVSIPQNYNQVLQTIVQWNLDAYMPNIEFNIMERRILEHLYTIEPISGIAELEDKELYYLNDCVSNAINNSEECGVDKKIGWELYHWIQSERRIHNV